MGSEFSWIDNSSLKKYKLICDFCINTYHMMASSPEPKRNKHCKVCGKVIKIVRVGSIIKQICWSCKEYGSK